MGVYRKNVGLLKATYKSNVKVGSIVITTPGRHLASDFGLDAASIIDVAFAGGSLKTLLDATKSAYYLFYKYGGASVNGLIAYGDTSEVTTMKSMFGFCTHLTSVPLLDTGKVTNMDSMFYDCESLTNVPLFDTGNVTTMRTMFRACKSLTSVPLFDTRNVNDSDGMGGMFQECVNLTSVPLFDTGNVRSMSEMFRGCTNLTSIPAFDTSNVLSMSYMFYGCANLTSVPALDASNVFGLSGFNRTFSGCSSLEEIHMTGIKVSLDISASTRFTESALVEILNNLVARTDSTRVTLTMGATNLAKLTNEEKAIATNKNWTLA